MQKQKARQKLIIANWKMNGSLAGLAAYAAVVRDKPMVICPPAALLAPMAALLKGAACQLGAQDCHSAASGAHTGETSAALLAELGVRCVIVGHAERRRDHGESDDMVWQKAHQAAAHGLVPIICVNENNNSDFKAVLSQQLQGATGYQGQELVVAYEPLAAIGSGHIPPLDYIEAVHGFIHQQLQEYLPSCSKYVIYGGSVNAGNAAAILAGQGVDGVLVGTASLDAQQLMAIWQVA